MTGETVTVTVTLTPEQAALLQQRATAHQVTPEAWLVAALQGHAHDPARVAVSADGWWAALPVKQKNGYHRWLAGHLNRPNTTTPTRGQAVLLDHAGKPTQPET